MMFLTVEMSTSAGAAWGYCRTTTVQIPGAIPGTCSSMGTPLQWTSHCAGFSLYRGDIPAGITVRNLDAVAQRDADCVGRTTDLDCVALLAAETWGRAQCDGSGLDGQYFLLRELPATWNTPGYNTVGENSNTVSFRHTWGDDATHRDGTIAITVVTFDVDTGEIYDADVELNTLDPATGNTNGFVFSTTAQTDPNAADLPTILTHEFGHLQGLAHSADDTAVMYYSAGLGEARRALTADDRLAICSVYPAINTPDTVCNPVPYGGLADVPGGSIVTAANGCAVRPGAGTAAGDSPALALALAFGVRSRRRRYGCSPAFTGRGDHTRV